MSLQVPFSEIPQGVTLSVCHLQPRGFGWQSLGCSPSGAMCWCVPRGCPSDQTPSWDP